MTKSTTLQTGLRVGGLDQILDAERSALSPRFDEEATLQLLGPLGMVAEVEHEDGRVRLFRPDFGSEPVFEFQVRHGVSEVRWDAVNARLLIDDGGSEEGYLVAEVFAPCPAGSMSTVGTIVSIHIIHATFLFRP